MSSESVKEQVSAYCYVRVSTARQVRQYGDFGSLEKQQKQLEYCFDHRKQQGWILQQTVQDKAELGDDENRPGLQQILKAARSREFDVLVVTSQDRLARGWGILRPFLEEVERLGIEVYDTHGRRISLLDPMNRMMTMMAAFWSEQEQETIRARRRSDTTITAASGAWPGGRPPLGYKSVSIGRARKLEIDPHTSVIVIELFNRVERGERIPAIIGDFKRRGIVTPSFKVTRGGVEVERGLRFFNAYNLEKMIENPLYKGYTKVSREVYERSKSGIKATPAGHLANGDVLFKGQHAALVSEETWARANEMLGKKVAVRKPRCADPEAKFILQGTTRCARCGSTVTNIIQDGRKYYTCLRSTRRYGPTKETCPVGTISAQVLEDAVLRMVSRVAGFRDFTTALLEFHAKRHAISPAETKALSGLKSQRTELATQRQNLIDAIAASKTSESKLELTAQLDRVTLRFRDVNRRLDALMSPGPGDFGSAAAVRTQLEDSIAELAALARTMDRRKMKELIREMFAAILIDRLPNKADQRRYAISLRFRYPEMAAGVEPGSPLPTVPVEILVSPRTNVYEVVKPFSETINIGSAIDRPAANVDHPIATYRTYSQLVEKMRPCDIAKQVGKTRAHVSQILSLKKITAPLRRRILAADPRVRSHFTLNKLLTLATCPPSIQEEEVERIINAKTRSAA